MGGTIELHRILCNSMGGTQARIQDFLKEGGGVKTFTSAPPLGHCPRDVIRPLKNSKTPPVPHSWTFTSTPPLDIARVTSTTLQGGGGGVIGPGHAHVA